MRTRSEASFGSLLVPRTRSRSPGRRTDLCAFGTRRQKSSAAASAQATQAFPALSIKPHGRVRSDSSRRVVVTGLFGPGHREGDAFFFFCLSPRAHACPLRYARTQKCMRLGPSEPNVTDCATHPSARSRSSYFRWPSYSVKVPPPSPTGKTGA